jgi:hypothetical protein
MGFDSITYAGIKAIASTALLKAIARAFIA